VLVRHGLNRLDHLDVQLVRRIRRMEMTAPVSSPHDIKKLGRIPKGGGWRVHGRRARPSTYRWARCPHRLRVRGIPPSMVTAESRTAKSSPRTSPSPRSGSGTSPRLLCRHDITVRTRPHRQRSCYRSRQFNEASTASSTPTPSPTGPRTNGKVERFQPHPAHRVAYARPGPQTVNARRAFAHWLHIYNHHRHHTQSTATHQPRRQRPRDLQLVLNRSRVHDSNAEPGTVFS